MGILVPFTARYLCELGFSMTSVKLKTKQRSRLDVTHRVSVALPQAAPNIDRLIGNNSKHKKEIR